MNNSIIDLRETSPNHWKAKYQGNYGVYTIKITTSGKQTKNFSCSCPSERYPCKHIAMIEAAVFERIAKNAKNKKNGSKNEISAEELLRKLSHEELYKFTAGLVLNNPDLSNAVLLEFSDKIKTVNANKYIPIIRRGLDGQDFNEEEYYYSEMGPDIEILDQWFEKARQYLKEKKTREAVLISQACIEEYAAWLEQLDGDMADYISEEYQSAPFEILEKAAADPKISAKELYDYCMTEVAKKKYAGLLVFDEFNDLLMKVSAKVDPDGFIALQHKLLDDVQDKRSCKAKKILQRLFDFYTKRRQSKKAWQCIEENIQIESFRKMVVEKKIKRKEFADAKKLIHEYIDGERDHFRPNDWDDYLLQIARQENDVPAIKDISFSFIKDDFEEKYYCYYKSTFSDSEWADAFENLLNHYQRKGGLYADPAADLLAAESKAERLLEHIEKKLSLKSLERYYDYFASAFPESTLALFRKALDSYAEQNTGRNCYEHIVEVLKKMKKIPGGDTVVDDMKNQYRLKYKNRKAMMEILYRGKF
ncbi:MAG: SWIM zinc finger family protein [Treponema sp.]|nr:SWIM zinc finger family protein [Treponema sp.]